MTYDMALSALSDPTRRSLFEAVARHPQSVTQLASGQTVSRPAISQHLRVLSDAGLVVAEPQGTRRIYRMDRRGLDALRRYLDQFWEEALEAFAAEVHRQTKED